MNLCRHALISITALTLSLGSAAPTLNQIIQGIEAKATEFPEVFSISYTYPGGPKFNFEKLCTATLIAPTVLLTSAHCLPFTQSGMSVNPIFASNELDAENALHTLPAVAAFRHPDYDPRLEEFTQASFDLGIVILAEPVQGVLPAPLASLETTSDRDIAFSLGLTVVGFGGKRTLYSDATTGFKRWAQTRALESTFSIFTTAGPTSALSRGDFGGPAFIMGLDGVRRLIGIASGIPHDGRTLNNGVPEVSLYAGIRPEVIEWIEKTTGKIFLNKNTKPFSFAE